MSQLYPVASVSTFKARLGILRERLLRPAVYAVSYPKSGRTWLQMMVSYVVSELSGVPIEKILRRQHRRREQHSGRMVPIPKFSHGHRYKYFCQGQRFPSWFYRNARVALLVRNPRDVVVSYYYYQKFHLQEFSGTLHQFVRGESPHCHIERHAARCGVQPIINYLNAWVRHEHQLQELFVLHYEDLKADPMLQLGRLCEFAGLDADRRLLEAAVDFASFDNMRRMEENRSIQWFALPGGGNINGFKTRRGKVNGYLDELDPHDVEAIDRLIDTTLDDRFSRYFSSEIASSKAAVRTA